MENAPATSLFNPPISSAPPKSARLKGKARQDAKNGLPPTINRQTQPQEHYIVNLKDLIPLADSIVNCKNPMITVPSYISRAGLRAVSARKKCTARFQEITGNEDTKESNERHSYFSTLLENVLHILGSRFATAKQRYKAHSEPNGTSSSSKATNNKFAALELEDFSEEEEECAASSPPQASTQVYELEIPQNKTQFEEEKMFGVFCMLEDFWQLRDDVSSLWKEYKDGEIDLITASVTTNAAFM